MKKSSVIILAVVLKTTLTAQVNTFISNSESSSGIAIETNNRLANPDEKIKAPIKEAEGKTIVSITANPPSTAKAKKGSVKVKVTKGGSWNYTWRTNSGTILEEHNNRGTEDSLINLAPGTYLVDVNENSSSLNSTAETITQTVTIVGDNAEATDSNAPEKTVSATENLNQIKFTVFPNPNSGEFSVDITGLENNHEVVLSLKNERGNTVYNSYFYTQDESSIQRKIVPETKLENGVYYCTISVQGIQHTVRVLVN